VTGHGAREHCRRYVMSLQKASVARLRAVGNDQPRPETTLYFENRSLPLRDTLEEDVLSTTRFDLVFLTIAISVRTV